MQPSSDQAITELKALCGLSIEELSSQQEKINQVLNSAIHCVMSLRARYGNPERNADDFFAGKGIALQSETLYEKLMQVDSCLQERKKAADCWAQAVLAVAAHYHHLVGPAMLAAANARYALGEKADAVGFCECVIEDFVFLLNEWEPESVGPGEENTDRLALKDLKEALTFWLSHIDEVSKGGNPNTSKYEKMLTQLNEVMNRPMMEEPSDTAQ